MPTTMKLFGRHKKLIEKTKNGEKVPSLELVEVLVQCNLVDNQYPYSVEPRTRKYVKGYRFLSFPRKYKKQLLDIGLNDVKTPFKKVFYKAAKLLGNKIA